MKITVLIVEDNPGLRDMIKEVIEEVKGVEVVGEAEDGLMAVRLIEELSPKVVFLDIGLPGKKGVELAKEIFDINPWIFIVFATAFSEYRKEAFDLYAFDYLVKPFQMNRLRQTMERIKLIVNGIIDGTQVNRLYHHPTHPIKKRQIYKNNDEYVFLNLDDIIFITKEMRKTVIHYIYGELKTEESLSVLENRLGGYPFFRSHKGFIVNLKMVRKIVPCSRSSFELVMADTKKRPLLTWENAKKLEEITNSKVFKTVFDNNHVHKRNKNITRKGL